MRIAQVDLKAFGHFTDRRIGFGTDPDFHIAFGPNEAGKTTLSRALKAALFGIPERTADNHRHANPNLRVGVVLARPGGERLAVMRRKARKNSLVAYDPLTGEELGVAIPDECLAAWLGGLTEGLYGSMFGLDHDELVAGGKALSEGRGEIGQSLFEAGAGLTSIRALRERLAGEADALFRPRAPTTMIFKVLDQYGSARKGVKEAQTRPAEWEALRKAADEAKTAYDRARERQHRLQRESRRLERLAAVLPEVTARDLALERLAALGAVIRLPADATTQRIAAETRLREAEEAQRKAIVNGVRLQAEREAIALPTVLLEETGSIEALYYSLEPYRTARDTVAAAKGRIELADAEAKIFLAAIGEPQPEDRRALIPSTTLRARVQSLATQGTRLRTESEAASRLAQATQQELADLNQELADVGPQTAPDSLIACLKTFEADGNPEAKAEDLARQAEKFRTILAADAAALGGAGVAALVAMGTPLPAELQGFREAGQRLEARKQSLREAIEKIENDHGDVAGEIEGLRLRGDVPTAEHLAVQRGVRDGLWRRIRHKAFPDPDASEPTEELPSPTEYELAVQTADATADSRFADAAGIAQHAELGKRMAQMRNAIALDRERLAVAEQEADTLQRQWRVLLEKHGLPSLGVAALSDWLLKREAFVQRHQSFLDLKSQEEATAGVSAALRARLSASLAEAGLPPVGDNETLAQAVARAREHVEQTGKAAASHKLLARKKSKAEAKRLEAEARIAECRNTLAAWQIRWAEAMAAIRLTHDAGAEEATARLGQFERLEKALDTVDTARAERDAAQATVDRVEREALRLCRDLQHDPANRPTDAHIETFYERLTDAKLLAQRFQNLGDRIADAVRTREQAEPAIRQAEEDLAVLRSAAGCETLVELAEAEGRSAECLRLEAEVAAIEARLVKASALPLPALLAQAEGQDPVQVQMSLERAGEDLGACTAEVETLHGKLIEAQTALGRVDGEAIAGETEQSAASLAARLSHLVADYAAARLASAVLSQVIETYQQRHQGPLLARASALFAAITGGRFVKVATDFDEDLTILVGVRPNGRRETVGNLSSGTRDQLFLALRLAAIESHVADQEPMPVVVDDIVINFDDASASATFEVLAELSKKTQVLFFTHHEHLLDRAAQAIGREDFTAHRL